jgi:hypothetical protein
MLLISMGFASSFGLQPTEALVPLFAVVGALAVITMSGSGSGPKGLLWNRPEKDTMPAPAGRAVFSRSDSYWDSSPGR